MGERFNDLPIHMEDEVKEVPMPRRSLLRKTQEFLGAGAMSLAVACSTAGPFGVEKPGDSERSVIEHSVLMKNVSALNESELEDAYVGPYWGNQVEKNLAQVFTKAGSDVLPQINTNILKNGLRLKMNNFDNVIREVGISHSVFDEIIIKGIDSFAQRTNIPSNIVDSGETLECNFFSFDVPDPLHISPWAMGSITLPGFNEKHHSSVFGDFIDLKNVSININIPNYKDYRSIGFRAEMPDDVVAELYKIEVRYTILHEIFHAIGLGHSQDAGDVMYWMGADIGAALYKEGDEKNKENIFFESANGNKYTIWSSTGTDLSDVSNAIIRTLAYLYRHQKPE